MRLWLCVIIKFIVFGVMYFVKVIKLFLFFWFLLLYMIMILFFFKFFRVFLIWWNIVFFFYRNLFFCKKFLVIEFICFVGLVIKCLIYLLIMLYLMFMIFLVFFVLMIDLFIVCGMSEIVMEDLFILNIVKFVLLIVMDFFCK